jgi:uncharacterized protein
MQNKYALITGASSGTGAAFAQEYAKLGFNLILTGRRAELLNSLAEELMRQYGIEVETVIADFANDNDMDQLIKKVIATNNIEVLINNAAFGTKKKFSDEDFCVYEGMVKTHINTTLKLTHLVLPKMIQRKTGTIVNVSSVGSYMPFPTSAVYVASKAFISLFTETLKLEVAGTGINVKVLTPGLMNSDFFKKLGVPDIKLLVKNRNWKWTIMEPEKVVADFMRSLSKKKTIFIPGVRNKLIAVFYTLKRFFM